MRYVILQKTRFPGYFQPIALWQLQHAEFVLKFNKRAYYERATRQGVLLLYTHDDAQRIIDYWQWVYPSAEYMLMAAPDTIDMVKG